MSNKLLMPALLLSGILMLTACQTTTPTVGIEVCKEWRPITYSGADTKDTQRQIIGGNAARDAYCD